MTTLISVPSVLDNSKFNIEKNFVILFSKLKSKYKYNDMKFNYYNNTISFSLIVQKYSIN